jgi:hypothetical protein
MIFAYMSGVARDRAADRGCTGGGEVADDEGPPGEIPRGFRFLGRGSPAGARAGQGGRMDARISVLLAPLAAKIEPPPRLRRLILGAAAACGGWMLILKYFLVVGAVLTAGLIALNAHLLPAGSTSSAPVYSATSASLPTVAPKAQPANTDADLAATPTQPPDAKSASPSRRSHHSARAHHRSH